jgi:hypothetical protein
MIVHNDIRSRFDRITFFKEFKPAIHQFISILQDQLRSANPTSKGEIIEGRQVTMSCVGGHSLNLRKLHYRQNCSSLPPHNDP